jgi:serine/threonine protein phosphatase 1
MQHAVPTITAFRKSYELPDIGLALGTGGVVVAGACSVREIFGQVAMLDSIQALFRKRPPSHPTVPPGQRVYAIGDVHGRADLFGSMIQAIERDDAARGPAQTVIVLLGDLIDRGPDSAEVLAMARAWQSRRRVRIICGNHEQVLLESVSNLEAFSHFMEFGGRETVLSYGVDDTLLREADLVQAHRLMISSVPEADLRYIESFEDYVLIGEYLFVHAGILPGKRLEDQLGRHLRWIREPFLSYERSHEYFVVHGHTITTRPDVRRNRLGLDTGAYMTGRLTAVGLEGSSRWLLGSEMTQSGIRSAKAPLAPAR